MREEGREGNGIERQEGARSKENVVNLYRTPRETEGNRDLYKSRKETQATKECRADVLVIVILNFFLLTRGLVHIFRFYSGFYEFQ